MKSKKVQELTRFEMAELINENCYAILPVGATEQHGPHLPIGTDVYLAEYVAKKLSERIDSVIFPSLNFGYSWVWKALPGTLTLGQEAFKKVLNELIVSMIGQGFRRIIIVNGHDSNNKAIRYVQREIKDVYPDIEVLMMFYPGMSSLYQKHMETPTWGGMFHADEWETSLMLAARPDLVDMSKAVEEYPIKPDLYGLDASSLSSISQSGIFGNPTKATREKGEMIIKEMIDNIIEILDRNKGAD